MFKKLSERFPAAASRLESLAGVTPPGGSNAAEPPAPSADGEDDKADAATSGDSDKSAGAAPPSLFPPPEDAGDQSAKSDEHRTGSLKAAISEKINSESVSAAAAVAATSMMGFMKKAQSVASVAAREGAAKATVWKNKALDAADMDALQRRLSYALDRSTGEVNLELLNFSYITDNVVAMGFPSMNLGTNRTLLRDNPIDLVAMYLNSKHAGHFMIWNLSGKVASLYVVLQNWRTVTDLLCVGTPWCCFAEETYDYAYFDNQASALTAVSLRHCITW